MGNYYDGTKLLSMSDINGNKPEIYLCTTNRSGGKTTYFSRLLVNRFKEKGEKFALLYRFNYEVEDCADKFFKDINTLFFPTDVMTSKRRANGIYHELFLNNVSCGYAIAMNSSDQLKRYSHMFSDVCRILFDEFQSETNHYCNDEVKKFISIHTSIARGQNKQVRYVPVYMLGNAVSLLNPYYIELGISTRLKPETNFLKGDGFVLEQGFVETASRAQLESSFNRAFADSQYMTYSNSKNVYLNDNTAFVEPPSGKSRYMCTIRCNGADYAIREYTEMGIIYCDNRADMTFPIKISVTTEDHGINYVMMRRNNLFIQNLRWYFEHACFRFKDLKCKEAVLTALSY